MLNQGLKMIMGGKAIPPITDIDGNIYTEVTIGTQVWLVEPLKTTKYNDGTNISLVTDPTTWSGLTTEAYTFYNNDPSTYKATYGALYNWYAVNTGKLAPTGYHIPTDSEYDTLINYLTNNGYGYQGSGSDIAKSMAKTSLWNSSGTGGNPGNDQTSNNASGFNAIPSGAIYGTAMWIGQEFFAWTTNENSETRGAGIEIYFGASGVYKSGNTKALGYSVRCLKN